MKTRRAKNVPLRKDREQNKAGLRLFEEMFRDVIQQAMEVEMDEELSQKR